MEITRRNAVTATLTIPAVTTLAACTTPVVDVSALEKQLVDIIDKVQKGVKDGCALVPAASSVLAVLKSLAGDSDIAKFLAQVEEGIAFISKACPAAAGALRGAQVTANIKGQDIPIVFY